MTARFPTFSEGQILAAADLTAGMDYTRLALALHERTEHLWGVAQGLQLKANNSTFTLSPGRAVDRLGRPIVVDKEYKASATDFVQQLLTDDVDYPVFVQLVPVAKNEDARAGKCAAKTTNRIEESVQVVVLQPGAEQSVLEQSAASVEVGFGVPTASDMVLVGWVHWKGQLFTQATSSSGTSSVRYVGVVASEVVAAKGSLGLRTRPDGPRFAVTVSEDTSGGCKLTFGRQNGTGKVDDVFVVNEKGDVTIKGTLSPPQPAETKAESGVISDGLILPLPPKLNASAPRLHVILTPVAEGPRRVRINGVATTAFPLNVACSYDVATRRVACVNRWWDVTDPTKHVDLPGTCNYLVIANPQ